ncbi:hypothetical protein AcV5_000240 [Taiwanofungus camphoratus]|nr:hypothetical protein AcV5_000240 [Antrodia cinnamomea]
MQRRDATSRVQHAQPTDKHTPPFISLTPTPDKPRSRTIDSPSVHAESSISRLASFRPRNAINSRRRKDEGGRRGNGTAADRVIDDGSATRELSRKRTRASPRAPTSLTTTNAGPFTAGKTSRTVHSGLASCDVQGTTRLRRVGRSFGHTSSTHRTRGRHCETRRPLAARPSSGIVQGGLADCEMKGRRDEGGSVPSARKGNVEGGEGRARLRRASVGLWGTPRAPTAPEDDTARHDGRSPPGRAPESFKTDLASCEVRGQWDEGTARLRRARGTSSKWLLHPGPLAARRGAGIKKCPRQFCQQRGEGRARLRRASVGPSSTRQPLTAPEDDTERTEGRSPWDRPPETSKMDLASCEVRGQWDEGAAEMR